MVNKRDMMSSPEKTSSLPGTGQSLTITQITFNINTMVIMLPRESIDTTYSSMFNLVGVREDCPKEVVLG